MESDLLLVIARSSLNKKCEGSELWKGLARATRKPKNCYRRLHEKSYTMYRSQQSRKLRSNEVQHQIDAMGSGSNGKIEAAKGEKAAFDGENLRPKAT